MSKKPGIIVQVLSAMAVTASLIFVAFEIRQNTIAQRAETRQSLSDASLQVNLARASDSALDQIFYGLFMPEIFEEEGREAPVLTFADSLRGGSYIFANLRNLENVYLQYHEGAIDRSVLETYSFANPIYQSPFFSGFWSRASFGLDRRFVSEFEEANGIRYPALSNQELLLRGRPGG